MGLSAHNSYTIPSNLNRCQLAVEAAPEPLDNDDIGYRARPHFNLRLVFGLGINEFRGVGTLPVNEKDLIDVEV